MVFNRIKEMLGGRVRFCVTAAAPISQNTVDFLKIAFCCPIIERYGQTEATGGCTYTSSNDSRSEHVGGPSPLFEVKTQDVPEMNYTNDQKNAEGEDEPSGEICFRGAGVLKGYYKDAKKTMETIDEEGWLHTGDIGKIRADGSIKIVDRKKNIFKLAQGEYIAPEKIENVYSRDGSILEIYVHGNSLFNYLVGIIVPNPVALQELAAKIDVKGTLEELVENQAVVDKFVEEINKKAKGEKLASFELVRKVKLVPKSLEAYNLLTVNHKLKRNEAKEYFKGHIEMFYSQPIE